MIPASPTDSAKPIPLPRLRRGVDLEIVADPEGGFPSVVIVDPVRGSYSKVLWPSSGLILLWRDCQTADDIRSEFIQQYGVEPQVEDVQALAKFLIDTELSETDAEGGWSRYGQRAASRRHGLLKAAMHNYLFFRVPLFHPDAFLKRALPWVAFAYSRVFWWSVAAIAAAGLYLTMRQWTDLVAAVDRALQFQQLLIYGVALLILKAIHEMGHALTAARYGCRVPSMGIAFMVGTPVFYTDTSDSWRLASDRQRLAIVFAGVAAESIVAAAALLAWPLLPDGPFRNLCFTFATASIVVSLMVNLNPLMRFDGYFVLSDILKVPNLQDRSFALGVWKMREMLFGFGEAPPELFRPSLQRTLIIYAYLTWIYRFFLFLGIAAIVYVVAGKALGIVLAAVEIGFFIVRPIVNELTEWWRLRCKIRLNRRSLVTGFAVLAGLVLVMAPVVRGVDSPGVLVSLHEQDLHLPVAATLTKVVAEEGGLIQQGQVVFEAQSPDLDNRLRTARLELRLLELQMSRLAASAKELEQAVVLGRAEAAARQKIEGLEAERRALTVRAPFTGRLVDLDPSLRPGTHVAKEQLLARMTGAEGARVKALVSDGDLYRIATGAAGVFISDEADQAAVPVKLQAIAPASNGELTEPTLADRFGGAVAAVETDQQLNTRDGWVEVLFQVENGHAPPPRLMRGSVWVEAEAVSPLALAWRQIGRVLVREQGF